MANSERGRHQREGIQAWLLIAAGDSRQYAGNAGYEDDLTSVYEYDSFVPNHKRVSAGSIAVLRDAEALCGVARIASIDKRAGTKTRNRCPECHSVKLKDRKIKRPVFRCECRAEFDVPATTEADCTKYTAHLQQFVAVAGGVRLVELRTACVSYNSQHAMNVIGGRLAALHPGIAALLSQKEYLEPEGADDETQYRPNGDDRRRIELRAIRIRRGQREFRSAVRQRYGDMCMVTGCPTLEVLEAAHIIAYKGDEDNNPANGLLLRSDIHTLFDLDLVGIDPDTLEVVLHPSLMADEYSQLAGIRLRIGTGLGPSRKALANRWRSFRR